MNPILRDIPDSLETDRLILRCPMPGDGPEANAAILETRDSLAPWMDWVHPLPTVEQSEERSRRARSQFLAREDLPYDLYLRDDPSVFVGGSGLHRMNWAVPRFEIGYWCRQRFQGQGYVTEAARALTRLGFETLGAERMEIHCDSGNEASARVALRAGYIHEATLLRHRRRCDGAVGDTLIFRLVREEYRALAGAAEKRA